MADKTSGSIVIVTGSLASLGWPQLGQLMGMTVMGLPQSAQAARGRPTVEDDAARPARR